MQRASWSLSCLSTSSLLDQAIIFKRSDKFEFWLAILRAPYQTIAAGNTPLNNRRLLKTLHIRKYKLTFLGIIVVVSALPLLVYAQTSNQHSAVIPPQKTVAEIIPLVNQYCGSCHKVPPPNVLPKISWPRVIETMEDIAQRRMGREYMSKEIIRDITAFYYGSSTETLPPLPYVDDVSDSLKFSNHSIIKESQLQLILNINAVDFGRGTEFLVCDGESKQLIRFSHSAKGWEQVALAIFEIPIHTQVVDYNLDGLLDIIVVDLGIYLPTGDLAGRNFLLQQHVLGEFEKKLLLDGLGRATDAHALDLDNDGDLDLAVAVFGGGDVGEVFWMENLGNGKHKKHMLLNLSGALNISPVDLNGDGKIDLVSLVAQEHEMIVGFINEGKGVFKAHTLARAPHPMFGSTSMRPVDLDGDGDIDILFTKGDAFDTQNDPKPYHGVQWLENKGNLHFQFHNIGRFYGASTAVAVDLDLDGDLDVIVGSWVNHWDDNKRQSLIWYENNGKQKFYPHPIVNEPRNIVTILSHDINKDGRPDIIAGSFSMTDLMAKVAEKTADSQHSPENSDARTLLPNIITLENRSLTKSAD